MHCILHWFLLLLPAGWNGSIAHLSDGRMIEMVRGRMLQYVTFQHRIDAEDVEYASKLKVINLHIEAEEIVVCK
jgi:hypothetical protein